MRGGDDRESPKRPRDTALAPGGDRNTPDAASGRPEARAPTYGEHDTDLSAPARRATDAPQREAREQSVRAAIRREIGAPGERPRAEDPGPAEGAIIELERVFLGFDDRPILEDISFIAGEGETRRR
jgi:hypothetical protein